jgi:hypothetical protein
MTYPFKTAELKARSEARALAAAKRSETWARISAECLSSGYFLAMLSRCRTHIVRFPLLERMTRRKFKEGSDGGKFSYDMALIDTIDHPDGSFTEVSYSTNPYEFIGRPDGTFIRDGREYIEEEVLTELGAAVQPA